MSDIQQFINDWEGDPPPNALEDLEQQQRRTNMPSMGQKPNTEKAARTKLNKLRERIQRAKQIEPTPEEKEAAIIEAIEAGVPHNEIPAEIGLSRSAVWSRTPKDLLPHGPRS